MATLRDWFLPDRPGPLVGLHVIHTGNGAGWVDRWPNPRAILTATAGNYALAGDPDALQPIDLQSRIEGFVEAPERFVPLLRAAFSHMHVWDRVILDLQAPPQFTLPRDQLVRRLGPADTYHLWGLSPAAAWVAKTWGGPPGLAASGCAWGAFANGWLVSVAGTFFMGQGYEEIGVVTEPEFRGQGLGVACAGALCEEIQGRGRRPSWTTSPDNVASLRVAEKLGFTVRRRDYLYVVGIPIPEAPDRQAE
jgi:RimJ/RimL family protein N-acetyltransferase